MDQWMHVYGFNFSLQQTGKRNNFLKFYFRPQSGCIVRRISKFCLEVKFHVNFMNVTKKKKNYRFKRNVLKEQFGRVDQPPFQLYRFIHASFVHVDAEPNLFIVNKLMNRIYYQSVVV